MTGRCRLLTMRTSTLLVTLALALAVPVPALASTVACDGGKCKGTDDSDVIVGSPRHDNIIAKAGDDDIDASNPVVCVAEGTPIESCSPSHDRDTISAGDGDDKIDVRDHTTDDPNAGFWPDTVNCGPGHDVVQADKKDKIADNCEDVVR